MRLFPRYDERLGFYFIKGHLFKFTEQNPIPIDFILSWDKESHISYNDVARYGVKYNQLENGKMIGGNTN